MNAAEHFISNLQPCDRDLVKTDLDRCVTYPTLEDAETLRLLSTQAQEDAEHAEREALALRNLQGKLRIMADTIDRHHREQEAKHA